MPMTNSSGMNWDSFSWSRSDEPQGRGEQTTVNVLSEDKSKCYMWLYCTGTDAPRENALPAIVLYDYQASRSGSCAADYLHAYRGYLQVDGYAGYEQTQARLVGCWAHARRKFVDAETAQDKGKPGKALWAINLIKKLYRLERLMSDKDHDEKKRQRESDAKPLLKEFKLWLDQSVLQVPPKSAIGVAIGYTLKQWDKLNRYLEDGALDIDNNRAERAIKPFVIGRKNWLFANTTSGAHASAVLYSIIETAKANDLIPFYYLMHLLTELPKPNVDMDTLMPWNVDLKS